MNSQSDFNKAEKNDCRSSNELIQLALLEENEDAYWDIISILHHRGNYEVFELASRLCESKLIQEKELGINILGQLGIPERSFIDESLKIFLQILEKDADIPVISAIGFALGHIKDPRGVAPLAKFKNHHSSDVRLSVVYGLLSQENQIAINTLIELSADEDEDVRNWATFGLGDMIETDTKSIRDALWQRLINETDETAEQSEIRGEALLGLANRKDERVVNILIAELSAESVGKLAVEAANKLGDERLYPSLMNLREWWDIDNNLLADAINSCKPKN